ncbi:MAG: hypothetical protein OHK0029_13980 [Armatimonadaceae bacterium]
METASRPPQGNGKSSNGKGTTGENPVPVSPGSRISAETAAEVADTMAAAEQRNTIRDAIHQNAAFGTPYVVMNTLATIVAAYGLLSDSTAVVIGAMIIAMLLGPITGLALALVDGDNELFRRSLFAEAVGATMVLGISYLLGTLHRDIPLTREMLARTHPNLLDLMIALGGGAAGAYATISPRISVGLVGVAIATALVPPLTTCGLCLARGEMQLAWGGFLLFFTNLVAIQFASSAVMWMHGFHRVTTRPTGDADETRRAALIRNGVSIAALIVLSVILGINFTQTLARQRFENEVRNLLERGLQRFPGVALAELRFQPVQDKQIISAVIRTPFSFSPEQVQAMEAMLPMPEKGGMELHIVSVIVKETTPNGYLHEIEKAELPDAVLPLPGSEGRSPTPPSGAPPSSEPPQDDTNTEPLSDNAASGVLLREVMPR